MYGQDIKSIISKGTFEMPHHISYILLIDWKMCILFRDET